MVPHDIVLRLALLFDLYFLLVTLSNIRFLNKHTFRPETTDEAPPRVSVILPVRNEERRLRPCLDSLLAQSYANLEIIAVNDNSEDGTEAILREYARRSPRISVVEGSPLEPGWIGKSFACKQGVDAAAGDFLLFTDADTVHGPDSVAWAVRNIVGHRAGFLSAYVRQRLGSLGELLVVPVIYIMTALLLPLGLIPRRNSSLFSFAIGQFIICRNDSLHAIGDYERFKGSAVDDISMAREMKRAGYKTIFLDAQGYVSCRMYSGFAGAFRGIGKSLFAAVGSSLVVLVGLMGVILIAVEYPVFTALSGVLGGQPVVSPRIVPVLLFALVWGMKLANRRMPLLAIAVYPFTFFILVLIGLYSAVMTGIGPGLDWKGRLVTATARTDAPLDGRPIVDVSPLFQLAAGVVFLSTLALVYLVARILYRIQIEGRERLAPAGRRRFLVSNHVLYLDAAMVACAIHPRKTFFSALEETFSIPFVGTYIRLLGAFPLPERDALRAIEAPVRRMFAMGRFVHFFPEGALSLGSQEIKPFKLGVFLLATRFDALVTPVTFALLGVRNGRPEKVKVIIEEPIDPRDYLRRSRASEAIRAMASDARRSMQRTIDAARAKAAPALRSASR